MRVELPSLLPPSLSISPLPLSGCCGFKKGEFQGAFKFFAAIEGSLFPSCRGVGEWSRGQRGVSRHRWALFWLRSVCCYGRRKEGRGHVVRTSIKDLHLNSKEPGHPRARAGPDTDDRVLPAGSSSDSSHWNNLWLQGHEILSPDLRLVDLPAFFLQLFHLYVPFSFFFFVFFNMQWKRRFWGERDCCVLGFWGFSHLCQNEFMLISQLI